MSSHEKNVTTTIEKPIYARVAKRIKQIPPADRNILTSRNTKLPPSWNLPQFLYVRAVRACCDCRLISVPGFLFSLPHIKLGRLGSKFFFFLGKPKWQVQWSEQWIFVFLSLEHFVNAWLAKNFGVEKNLPEARHQLYTPQSSRAKQTIARSPEIFIHWELVTVSWRRNFREQKYQSLCGHVQKLIAWERTNPRREYCVL